MQKKHISLPKKIQDHPNPSVQKLNLSIFVGSKQPILKSSPDLHENRKIAQLLGASKAQNPRPWGEAFSEGWIPGTLKLTFSLPENGWLECDRLLLGCRMAYFHGLVVGFRECSCFFSNHVEHEIENLP